MKIQTRTISSLVRFVVWVLLAILAPQLSAFAQGTAFTYQGRLDNAGTPYSGSAEFQVTLWDAASSGTALASNNPAQIIVGVTNGLFVLPLSFGANFPGGGRWLELEVRTTIGAFNVLVPRQPLTPTPYAITASNLSGTLPAAQVSGVLPSANLGGIYSGVVTFINAGNGFTGNGGALTDLNASQLASGTVPDTALASNVARTNQVWLLVGNAEADPANGAFLGTTDTNALEFVVNGQRALRIEYATNSSFADSPNMAGGFSGNIVSNGFVGAVIGGGGNRYLQNRVGHHFATVVGGIGNTASGFASTAMGNHTTASGGGAIAMGYSTMASGLFSTAMGSSAAATGYVSTAMGFNTTAGGYYSTALGHRAKASHDGSFVWGDSQADDFASSATNQFLIRAQGGVGINTTNPGNAALAVNGRVGIYGANVLELGYGVVGKEASAGRIGYQTFTAGALDIVGAGSAGLNNRKIKLWAEAGATFSGSVSAVAFNPTSDRNAKENFTSVDSRAVLEKVAVLPISQWNFKQDANAQHIGPMAQDFRAAFGTGADDKHIATVDADGVALAAIQGLNQKLEEKDAELQALKQTVAELKAAFDQLGRAQRLDPVTR